jgi:hypothetical protein
MIYRNTIGQLDSEQIFGIIMRLRQHLINMHESDSRKGNII